MPMRKSHLRLMIAAAVLALPAAYGQDKLKGLEMDVMQPGETPAQATATIDLPVQGNAARNAGAANAADAHDNAAANSQDNVELAHGKKSGNGNNPDHPGPPAARPSAPQRPEIRPPR